MSGERRDAMPPAPDEPGNLAGPQEAAVAQTEDLRSGFMPRVQAMAGPIINALLGGDTTHSHGGVYFRESVEPPIRRNFTDTGLN